MPQRKRAINLGDRNQRAKLRAQAEPYWEQINQGTWLGYRKGRHKSLWWVRLYNRSGHKPARKAALGAADDVFQADGISNLSYLEALNLARNWSSEEILRMKGTRRKATYTVAEAMRDYMQNFIRRGYRSVVGTQRTIEFHILPVMGHIRVENLTREDVRQWLQSVLHFRGRVRHYRGGPTIFAHEPPTEEEVRRRKQTANRLFQILKAALNIALQEGFVECSGAAWREVLPFIAARSGRTRFLSDEEQRMFIAACEGDFRRLALGALFTGARQAELVRLRVEDFLGNAVRIPSEIAKTKQERTVFLSRPAARFFQNLAGERPPQDLLFTLNNHRWTKMDQWSYTRSVSRKAELRDFSFCVLRHTAASNWVRAGIPLKYIAEQLGHSITICEKHYAHVAPDHRSELFANLPPSSITGMEDFSMPKTK